MVIVLISCLIILAGFLLAARGFLNLEKRYTNSTFSQEEIEDLSGDLAGCSGTVQPQESEELLRSPISDEECVLFALEVEEKEQQGTGPVWDTRKLARVGIPFYLEDDTGSILVDPDGAELDLFETHRYSVPNGVVPQDPVRSAKQRIQEQYPDAFDDVDLNLFDCQTSKDTRFIEYIIHPNETLSVIGSVMDRQEGRTAYYDDRDTKLIYSSSNTPKFVLYEGSDGNRFGPFISVFPWMVGALLLFLTGTFGLMLTVV